MDTRTQANLPIVDQKETAATGVEEGEFTMRFAKDDAANIRRAAAQMGLSPTEFARRTFGVGYRAYLAYVELNKSGAGGSFAPSSDDDDVLKTARREHIRSSLHKALLSLVESSKNGKPIVTSSTDPRLKKLHGLDPSANGWELGSFLAHAARGSTKFAGLEVVSIGELPADDKHESREGYTITKR